MAKKFCYRLLLSLLILAPLSAPAVAEELTGTLKRINSSGTITLGYRENSIPFSYVDKKNKEIVGYAIDLCMKVVDEIKVELKRPDLKIAYKPVTTFTRIPMVSDGSIDIECGSSTNAQARRNYVDFSPTYYVARVRYLSKASDNIQSTRDVAFKTVAAPEGTLGHKLIESMLHDRKDSNTNLRSVKDPQEGLHLVESDQVAALVAGDILLRSLIAHSQTPDHYVLSKEALSTGPYAAMIAKDDKAFKAVVDRAFGKVYKSGEIETIYKKWFLSPIPPDGVTLNVPWSVQQKIFDKPTDSSNPADYQ